LTPLVGRDEEIDLLLRRWARAKAGDGQVVLISGEPGIGKSRIAAALVQQLEAEPHLRLRYFCSPYHQDSALYPFIDQLGRASGFARDDPTPHHIALQASACEIAGQIEEGVVLLDDALQMVERTGKRWFAAELNRHKGQLLLRQGHSAAAEELYRRALSIAEEQEAKLWELRRARPARPGLRLVYRGLCHPRSQRGKGGYTSIFLGYGFVFIVLCPSSR
jgi:hypothetical protein